MNLRPTFFENLKAVGRSIRDTIRREVENHRRRKNPTQADWQPTQGASGNTEPAKIRGHYAKRNARNARRRKLAKQARKVMYRRRKAAERTF